MSMMLKHPNLFMGVEEPLIEVIDIIAKRVSGGSSKLKVMLVLRKIRLNESFAVLAIYFSLAETTVSKYFHETLPTIAACMSELVFKPEPAMTLLNLPLAFRQNFHDVQYTLDCFEIQIEKSSNAEIRASCWSQYKGGTTLKFLISVTPDCFCNFISRGYGGRISDVALTNESNFMALLKPGEKVMADRGFKSLEASLDSVGVMLKRPPSVAGGQPMSEDNCKLTKEIASLRVHVERFIGKLRTYLFLAPHATTSIQLVPCVELAVKVVVGLVNLGRPLIRWC
jgi:hypothetical protein